MRRLALFGLLIFTSAAVAADRSEWLQWRGPQRTCIIEAPAWPDKVDEQSLVELYRVPLEASYSGPIVTKDKVFVTETVNKEKEVVRALDRDSGKELWNVEWPGAMSVPFFAASNGSWIRATPIYDGKRLYVVSMIDELAALNGETGKQEWRIDFKKEFETNGQTFGACSSPLIEGGALYIQTSGGLIKINCEDGSIIWRGLKEEGGMMGGAFSSPMMAELAGRRQLVIQTRSRLCGVDPDTGNELWGVDVQSFRDMNILTPTAIGDRIFTSSYGGGALMFEVSKAEDGTFAVKELWKNTTEAYMSSPVVIDGKIYLHLRNERFCCLDPATGESLWRTTPFGKYWSIVANGTKILALDEEGDLILIDANPTEYKQLDLRHVTDATAWAHLAVADNQVFVRALDALIVYKWE
ncbi:MAG: PQQ-binding-like beta-propeller repeat protein [Planctomycetota bacterium]